MTKAINKVLKGSTPFTIGSKVYYVDRGVKSFVVADIDKLGCNTRLWDATMDIMVFTYEGFETYEEAEEAYELALKTELAKLNKTIDGVAIGSVLVAEVDEEVLEEVGNHCEYFLATDQGGEAIIVLVKLIEDYTGDVEALKKLLAIAKRANCTYLHLKAV